jgi:iron complex outermembrane recepter protein
MNRKKQLAVAIAATFFVGGVAYAQQGQQTPQKVEKVEVTGSNIKRIDAETAAPIQIITSEEIRRSGKDTITEVLRTLPSNAAGGLTDLNGSNSFSTGASSISLRGLGSSSTLVLLNGRRIAPYGLADPNFGQSGAVNINAIPLTVVERIEVFKDGASAIYGSEAIAGVVNIILRKDFKGGEVAITGGMNKDGDYGRGTVSGTIGFGDLASNGFNGFVTIEAYQAANVMFKDVDSFLNRKEFQDVYFTGVASSTYAPTGNFRTGGPNRTTVWAPGAGCPTGQLTDAQSFLGGANRGTFCLFDQWDYVEISPKSERNSIFARTTFGLGRDIQAFAEGSFTQNKTYFVGAPRIIGQGTGGTFSAATGRINSMPSTLSATNPFNPTGVTAEYRGRLIANGQTDTDVKSDALRLAVGLKGFNAGWDWEVGALHNENKIDVVSFNQINLPAITAGINSGAFNPFNPSAASLQSVDADLLDTSTSKFSIFDVKASRELFALPGGNASIALGAEYRRESRVVNADQRVFRGEILGRGVSSADASRNVSTVYGEMVLPAWKGLELQLAARHDRYSDFGNSTTPKIALSYAPVDAIKFRGSYAEGYRAPSLTEVGRSSTSGFFNGVDDPRRCNRAAGITAGCGVSIPGLINASTFLRAETAKSTTVGFVFEPVKDTSVSVDYFDIKRKDEITFLSLTDILANEGSTSPRYANRVVRDPAQTAANIANDPGAILYVITGFDNQGKTSVSGLDIDARRRFALANGARVDARFNLTHYLTQKGSSTPDDPEESFNGLRNSPRNRASLIVSYEQSAWTLSGIVNYVGSFRPYADPSVPAAQDCGNPVNTYLGVCRVKESFTVDLGVQYTGVRNLTLNATVRNIANQRPPLDPLARPFNTNWYPIQGINFVAGARYQFR